MGILTAPSKTAQAMIVALNLPKTTFAFTFRMCVGEAATIEVHYYPEQQSGEELVSILKRYQLQELEE